jgi:hypothetical protein
VRNVSDKERWATATSIAGPSVTYSPARQAPVLAWRGDQNSRNLTIAYIVGTPGQLVGRQLETHVSRDASEHAPAIHYRREGDLVLAWVGINPAQTVNAAIIDLPSGTRDVVSRQRVFVNDGPLGSGGSGPVSLAPFGPLGITLACLNESGTSCFSTANQGIAFDAPRSDPDIDAIEGIALEVGMAAWTRRSDNRLLFQPSPIRPGSPFVSAQSSLHRPALASFGGHLYVAWVGTDGDGHLNVARVQTGAFDTGGDPIDPGAVDTLTELSLAAPVLVSLPPEAFSPERLAIFWTGVDGSGTINGAVVYP